MISIAQYFGDFDHTDEQTDEALDLLERVVELMDCAFADGVDFRINPSTMSHIAGTKFGGFRPLDCCEGAPSSSHKQAMAVDVFDGNKEDGQPFAKWCLNNLIKLEELGLYMEHPSDTVGRHTCWVHLTTRAPGSGKRVFQP